MAEIEYTDEFGGWWEGLTEAEQESVAAAVELLAARGASLGHPWSSQIKGSKHGRMRELRIQHQGRPIRVFYAFDPRRVAVLAHRWGQDGGWPLLRADGRRSGRALRRAPRNAPAGRENMMAGKWQDLRNGMSAEAQERVAERVDRELLGMRLAELRKSIGGLTQVEVAELLDSTQGAISQLEKREDALLSTLAQYVEALGGRLEVVARFDDREDVRITQFDEVREQLAETG